MSAYADGDGERIWVLSTDRARATAVELQRTVLEALMHPDPVERVKVEGLFGQQAADISTLHPREFFLWAIAAIRQRLGAAFVRRTVSDFQRIVVEYHGEYALVSYREAQGTISQLRVQRDGELWRVDQSPFESGDVTNSPGPGGGLESANPAVDAEDRPLQPGEVPWDPFAEEPGGSADEPP
jgi:hypothetical protein